jgi:hypothetical protein
MRRCSPISAARSVVSSGPTCLTWGKIQGLGAPVASIGGAGTFEGKFLTGAFAVLLASIFSPPANRSRKSPRRSVRALP